MVLIKNWQFFHVFILGKKGQENVFHDNLESENAFLDHKNKKLKNSKNWDFSQGVSPQFWSKITNFSIFLFQAKQGRKYVLRYSRNKNRLSRQLKHQIKKKSKNYDFPTELVHGTFGQKLALSPSFYFKQNSPGKCVSRYSREKIAFLDH